MRYLTVILFFTTIFASTDLFAQSENYYAPWHCKIKDTTHQTVSKFGHYISFGLGSANNYNIGGQSFCISYSLAYKSHVFSLTHVGYGIFNYGGSDREPYSGGGYYGFLYGESIRAKNVFLSLSAGVANSNVDLKYLSPDALIPTMTRFDDLQDISFPIELKFFLLAHNGGGLGISLSKNIISPANFSPFFVDVSIVFGGWNKARVKK